MHLVSEKKEAKERGAIVVEATIALSTFMFLIVTILGIVNICLAQAKIGILVNGISKDVSNYSYVYSVVGLKQAEQKLSSNGSQAAGTVQTVLDDTTETYDKIETLVNAAGDKEFWKSMGNLLVNVGVDYGKGYAINSVCHLLAKDRLVITGMDADAYLHWLGIDDGVAGLHFEDSEFCPGGSDDIRIVVHYKVHMLRLLNKDLDFYFTQTAQTKAWASSGNVLSAYQESKAAAEKNAAQENEGNSTEETEPEEDKQEDDEEQKEEPSEEEYTPKTTEQYVRDATHNPSANQVMLGKYTEDEWSYIDQAQLRDMTYFSLDDDDWDELQLQGADAAWEVNRYFLEEQIYQQKSIYVCSDPFAATGFLAREVEWLENRGYTFEYDPGAGLWRAVLKEDYEMGW